MAECYAHEVFGNLSCFAGTPDQVKAALAMQVGDDMVDWGRVVPLQVQTAKSRHAEELYQVLRDLTAMAKLGVPISGINTYLAAIRNAEQLLEKIDEELEKDSDHDQQA
jgi:hypothetical protein